MFGWLKPDPVKKLRKAYDQKLEQAMHAQRNGDGGDDGTAENIGDLHLAVVGERE